MKTTLLAIMVFSLTWLTTNAQKDAWEPVVQKGKVWISVEADASTTSPAWATSHALRIGDTVGLFGTTYNMLYITHDQYLNSWYDYGLVREDSTGKVWYQTYTCGPERLMYDFGATEGTDVIIAHTTPGSIPVSGTVHVGTVDTVFLAGKDRKRLQIGSGYWIEGIGSTSGLMFSGLENVSGISYSLLCYYQDTNLVYQNDITNPFYPSCWTSLITSTTESVPEGFSIYPVPASDYLMVNMDLREAYQVFSSSGQDVTRFTSADHSGRIDISTLKPGLYSLRLTKRNTYQSEKFVKF